MHGILGGALAIFCQEPGLVDMLHGGSVLPLLDSTPPPPPDTKL